MSVDLLQAERPLLSYPTFKARNEKAAPFLSMSRQEMQNLAGIVAILFSLSVMLMLTTLVLAWWQTSGSCGIGICTTPYPHYDYCSDKVRRSAILDAKADILLYGNAEGPLLEVAHRLPPGEPINSMTKIHGTTILTKTALPGWDGMVLIHAKWINWAK
jgi:hypothetical protein